MQMQAELRYPSLAGDARGIGPCSSVLATNAAGSMLSQPSKIKEIVMSSGNEETDFDHQEELASWGNFLDRQWASKREDTELSRFTETHFNTETDFKPQNYHVQKSSRPYEPKFVGWTEKFRLIGAQPSELEDFFAVDTFTMEAWAREYPAFAQALNAQPTALGVTSEDIGLFNWLKDYRRGGLGI